MSEGIKSRRKGRKGRVANMGQKIYIYICVCVCVQEFGRETCRKQVIWKRENIDWIHLDQDRNKWRTLVNATMNIRVP